MHRLSRGQLQLLIGLVAALFFLPFLGYFHLFDWDEINFAECAREMLATGNYTEVQINFQPFWEKPPFFIWLQALAMNFFGINEFAARLPNAICGIATLIVLFRIGSKIFDHRFGVLWALSFGGSILPFIYFKSGIIDPTFNLFIFLGVFRLVLLTNNPNAKNTYKNAILAGLFFGLATLTKGPVAILIPGICILVFLLIHRNFQSFSLKSISLFLLSYFIIAGSWFFYLILNGKISLVQDFIEYQIRLFSTEDSGHGGFIGYHFVVLLLGCFPASLYALIAWQKKHTLTPFQQFFRLWMKILFWTVLLLFSLVKTKIIHYSSLCYFPLTFFAANSIHSLLNNEIKWKKWGSVLGYVLLCIPSLIFIGFPILEIFKEKIISANWIKDAFILDCFSARTEFHFSEFIPGLLLLVVGGNFFYKISKGKFIFIPHLFFTVAASLFLALILIVPKIEKYVQGAEIRFFESLKNQKCYVETVSYKSFAHLFYAEKKPELNTPELLNHVKSKIESDKKTNQTIFSFSLYATNYMRGEPIRYPAFFSVKSDNMKSFEQENPHIKKLYQEGGFIFYYRPPSLQNK